MAVELAPFVGDEHLPFEFGEGPGGVLLIHGFPGTPAEMRPLGRALAANGWYTRGLLLPGLGPEIVNINSFEGGDWTRAVLKAWESLCQSHSPRVLIGYSLGGAIALNIALQAAPDKMVLISPFWQPQGLLLRFVPFLKLLIADYRPFARSDFGDMQFREDLAKVLPETDLDDPDVQAYLRQQYSIPLRVIHDIIRLGKNGYSLARSIHIPTLIVQGKRDLQVPQSATRKLVNRFKKRLITYQELPGGHDFIQKGSKDLQLPLDLIVDYLHSPV